MPREAKFKRNKQPLIAELAAECAPLLDDPVALAGFRRIASKFRSEDDFGPTTVRTFLADAGHSPA